MVIKLIGDAIVLQKKLNSPLNFISFQEWFYILEAHAKAANQENNNELRIVSLKKKIRSYFLNLNSCLAWYQTS